MRIVGYHDAERESRTLAESLSKASARQSLEYRQSGYWIAVRDTVEDRVLVEAHSDDVTMPFSIEATQALLEETRRLGGESAPVHEYLPLAQSWLARHPHHRVVQ